MNIATIIVIGILCLIITLLIYNVIYKIDKVLILSLALLGLNERVRKIRDEYAKAKAH